MGGDALPLCPEAMGGTGRLRASRRNFTEGRRQAPPDKAATVDLDAMTVDELTALRDAAENKRQEKLEAAKDAVLNEAREELAKLGMTLEAAMPGRGGEGRGQALPSFDGAGSCRCQGGREISRPEG